jgi:hypothetical protein
MTKKVIATTISKSSLSYTFLQLLVVFIVPKILGLILALIIPLLFLPESFSLDAFWDWCIAITWVISAILMYFFTFWLTGKYIKRGYFKDKKFKTSFLVMAAIFFLLNFDFSISLGLFITLIFYIRKPELLNFKNLVYRPYFCFVYWLYVVCFFFAVIGNILFQIIQFLDDGSKAPIYLAGKLIFRYALPFCAVFIFSFSYFFKNGFNKFLKLSKENFIFYQFTFLFVYALFLLTLALSFLKLFVSDILLDSVLWLAVVTGFIFLTAFIYSFACWLFKTTPAEGWWRFLLKTAVNLYFIPIGFALMVDFIFINVYTLTNALNWHYVLPNLYKPFRLIYALFVLYFYLKYKKELTQDKVLTPITYLLIIMFIVYWLEFVINMTLLPRI